jgi:hypothetical protein
MRAFSAFSFCEELAAGEWGGGRRGGGGRGERGIKG